MTPLLRSVGFVVALTPLAACFDFLDPEPADLAEGVWALETTGSHFFGDCGAMGSMEGEPSMMEVFVAVDHDEVTLSFGPEPLEGTLQGTLLTAEAVYSLESPASVAQDDEPVDERTAEVDCMEPEEADVNCAEVEDEGPGRTSSADDEVVYVLSGEVASRDAFSGTLRVDIDLAGSVCSVTTAFDATLVSEDLPAMDTEPRTPRDVSDPVEG